MSPPDEAEADSTRLENLGWRGPLRGDFMTMAPFRLNTLTTKRLSAALPRFLVTRRNPLVSESDMRHGSTNEKVGLIRFTNRRPAQRKTQEAELIGRVNPPAANSAATNVDANFTPDLPPGYRPAKCSR